MLSRLLFWLALAFLVLMAIRSKLKNAKPSATPAPPRAAAPPEAEAMLRCAHCGIHYPASESVAANGGDYCSAAHARLPVP